MQKYKIWIVIISIILPIIVAILFSVRIPNVPSLSFLPPIYATINGMTSFLLVIAVVAIRRGNIKLHENIIKICIILSTLFLLMYMAYHMTSDSTPYGGVGWLRVVYLIILLTHILLSIVIIPLVLITFFRAWLGNYEAHRKIARFTFPLWLYVTISGVVIYLMISPYYTH